MKKILEKLKNRYNILSISIILVGLIFSYQLYNLQIVKGKEFDDRNINERRVKAPRGAIKDCNGIPIAINRTSYIIQIYKTKIKEAELNDMIFRLVNILEKNEKDKSPYISDFGKYLTPKPFAFGSMLNTKDKTDMVKLDRWKKDIGIKKSDMAMYDTPDKLFSFLRKYYKIQNTYSDEDAYKIISVRYELIMKGYSSLNPLVIAKDVSQNTVAEVDERHDELPGVTVNTQPVRKYVNADMESQLIGYVGKIEDFKKYEDEGYQRDDVIGKSGMEYQAENYLRGRDGAKTIEEDSMGKQTGELGGNDAIPGNDVYLTLDSKLQRVAMESLKNNIEAIRQKNEKNNLQDAFAGSAVAIDVNNGEVLAMASYPGYDPSVFLEPSSNKAAQDQINNWLKDSKNIPTYNRAIQGTYIPGSTFKPLTAIASLEEGVNTPDRVIYDSGVLPVDGHTFYCLEYRQGLGPHYDLTLERALATSCNIYFHQIGMETGIDNVDKWAKIFGLGEKTGIDLPGEKKGNRASREYKKSLPGHEGWYRADTAQAAIGQQYHSYTPIQLANYVATIANGGKKFKPHLIKKVTKYDGSIVTETEPEFAKIDIKPQNLAAVQKGMIAVANATDGTAVDTFMNFPYKVAGKTGTPESGHEDKYSSNALFICYAPAEAPKIAVAVVVERGAWGSNAAPIARDIMAQYFNLNNTSGNDDRIRTGDVVFTP